MPRSGATEQGVATPCSRNNKICHCPARPGNPENKKTLEETIMPRILSDEPCEVTFDDNIAG
ncbi:MAG: hypothetical protein ABFD76_09040, partial [Smithella sp.]